MNITVLGIGYVGLVTATCLAEIGNDVVCFDVDREKIDLLRNGEVPFHERDLPELIGRNTGFGRLRFASDAAEAVRHGDVIFIAAGTPAANDGSADLRHVLAAAQSIGEHMQSDKIVVQKSTVPVGTAERLSSVIVERLEARKAAGDEEVARLTARPVAIVSNPEFLKEGAAVDDFMRPDRIVIGTEPGVAGERPRTVMSQLYAPFNRQRDRMLHMDVRSAELTKYAANAMLATRISFMNELANLADTLGVDIEQVRKGIGADPRIGNGFLYAGVGYGGSCFPKDVQALVHAAAEHGQRLQILEAVRSVNDAQKHVLVDKIVERLGPDLTGRKFALWGLAFKPNTDDMREAPSRVVIDALAARGARVVAYDPVAMSEARRVFADVPHLAYAESPIAACDGADALVVITEWKEFRSPDFDDIKSRLSTPLVFDGRNVFSPELVRAAGLEYFGIGRR